MSTLFVADIHLGGEHPHISQRFNDYLRQAAPGADALYILGDLFETWIGDDAAQNEHLATIETLRSLTQNGLPVYVMHGNRDFLLRKKFASDTGCQIITDPTVIDLYGTPTLLMHGDTLCTDDTAYLTFRQQVRDERFLQDFLSKSIEERVAIARHIRESARSEANKKSAEIMDVNQNAVLEVMQQHGVHQLIHGHTHRPAVHNIEIDGAPAQRIVLGDWYSQNSWLECDEDGCRLSNLQP